MLASELWKSPELIIAIIPDATYCVEDVCFVVD